MRCWLGLLSTVLLGVGACTPFNSGAFVCADDDQCDQGLGGRCELNGSCSYEDDRCDSGRRYGDLAGALSGVCLGEEPVDAAVPLDANPNQPDADPNAPDANPNAPDAAPVEPTTLTFQDGVAGYNGGLDTFVDQGAPDTSNGGIADFEWDADGTVGLLRFDNLFGGAVTQIPLGATISSATLTLIVNNSSSGAAGDLHEAASDWNEASTFNTLGGTPGVQAEDLGVRIADAPIVIGTHVFDVQAGVQAWANAPLTNRGWIFNPNSTDGCHAVSREGATASRPLLTVTFTP